MHVSPTALVFVIVVLNGCTHALSLPSKSGAESCPLRVIDTRPEPDFLYADSGAIVRIETIPPIAESIRQSVCASVDVEEVPQSLFTVHDYTCTASGFLTITYVAEIRGVLEVDDEMEEAMRASSVIESAQGYVPEGCEAASAEAVNALTDKVNDAIRATSVNE